MKCPSLLCVCIGLSLLIAAGAARSADTPAPAAPRADPFAAQQRTIDKWRGTWQVTAIRRAPQPTQEITYDETFAWTLDGRFLRSETSRKSDGGRSMSMFWFDVLTKSYRWVVYDAAGFSLELPPPEWNEAAQTMRWESGALSPTSYKAYATFKDADTIQWQSVWKDWKGSAIVELEGVSRRRR